MIYTITLNPSLDRTLCFPSLRIGALNRATSARVDLSGKGVNVSMALREFGLRSILLGFYGGVSGRVLVDGLERAGYRCEFQEVAGETRSNITVIDQASGVTTKLNEPGPRVAEADVEDLQRRLVSLASEGDLCVFSGSLPTGAPVDTYERLIRSVAERGAAAVLDSSGEALRLGCQARPYLVKPNVVEAGELLGIATDEESELADLAAAMRGILALGPQRVLLSLGRQGAAYSDGRVLWVAEAPEVREANAVGAGDALLAGALWADSQGLPPEEMLRWGVAAGTAAAMQEGSAMPRMEQIRSVYGRVRVLALA